MTSAAELVTEFVEWCRGPGYKAPSTAEAYRQSLVNFVRVAGVADFATVTPSTLDFYVTRLKLATKLSDATIRSRSFALRVFFAWAHSRDRLPKNPASKDLFKIPGPREVEAVSVLEVKEIERILNVRQMPVRGPREPERFFARRAKRAAGNDDRDRALFAVTYDGALRVSETCALLWSDLEVDADGKASILLRKFKRSLHPEVVPLDHRTAGLLLLWKTVRRDLGIRGGSIFGLTVKGARGVFDRLWRLAGITPGRRRMTFHMIRASAATHASEAGMSDRDVQALLRHARFTTTERYLRKRTPEKQRRIRARFLFWNAAKFGQAGADLSRFSASGSQTRIP